MLDRSWTWLLADIGLRHARGMGLLGAGISRADTELMTVAAMKIERSGPAIRAALAEFAADECAVFEAELGEAITRAAEDFDLAPAEAVLDRWWGVAVIRANPLTEPEQAQLDRARAGDVAGLLTRDEHGSWARL